MDYGLFIYFPTPKNNYLKLEKIQLAAIRISLGYRCSTPTNIILAESKLQSIQDRARFLCNFFLTKALSNSNLITYQNIHQFYKITRKRKRKEKKTHPTMHREHSG